MTTNSGQLLVDFDDCQDWEETELEHVGAPSMCISTLRIKVDEVLGRLITYTKHKEKPGKTFYMDSHVSDGNKDTS